MASRQAFLSQEAPENYVAGLGRGATGFTTRSDLGPAREGPSEEQIKEALAKRAAQLGLSTDAGKKGDDNDDEPERYQDPDNEVGLFAGGIYDKDDDEDQMPHCSHLQPTNEFLPSPLSLQLTMGFESCRR